MKIVGLVSAASLVAIMVSGCIADGTEQSQESEGEDVGSASQASGPLMTAMNGCHKNIFVSDPVACAENAAKDAARNPLNCQPVLANRPVLVGNPYNTWCNELNCYSYQDFYCEH